MREFIEFGELVTIIGNTMYMHGGFMGTPFQSTRPPTSEPPLPK